MIKKVKHNKYAQSVSASLDLHGYTIDEAEELVIDFLNKAKASNYQQVRIITGKGINSPDGRARLKPWLEAYLSARRYRFMAAKVNEGGEGALDIKITS
ncbi:MAG TPA: Smr/MutS family protein [bacterium]|nr:Smr/MutS family protein [bacterium]